MKKIITIILAIITIFSVFAITGCGENSTQKPDSKWAAPSSSARPSKVNPTSQIAPSTTQGGISISGGGVPQISTSGTGTTSEAPTASGEAVHIPTDGKAPAGAPMSVQLLVLTINNLEMITKDNFRDKLVMVKDCEDEYNKLTSAEKAMVVNYGALLKAKEACNNFNSSAILVDFEAKVNSLPDATALRKIHVTTVNQAVEMLNSQRTYLSANLANFASYEAKLNACNQAIKNATVESTYIAQDGNGNGIMEAAVSIGGKDYSEIAGAKKRGSSPYTSVSNPFNITDSISGGNESQSHIYSDTKNTNVKIWQYANFSNITFTAQTPGTLTLYVRVGSNRTYTIAHANGQDTLNSGATEASCYKEIEVSAGQVSITVSGGTGYLCAMKFSYPNLPD